MEISDLMTREVRSCHPEDSLQVAAGMMWDGDCGCVPVVDGEGRLVGMLTDRDVAMAAYTKAECLTDLTVSGAMSAKVFTVAPSARIEMAECLMREYKVRRLPVVGGRSDLTPAAVGETLARICAHRAETRAAA